jgi:hypothetical protein
MLTIVSSLTLFTYTPFLHMHLTPSCLPILFVYLLSAWRLILSSWRYLACISSRILSRSLIGFKDFAQIHFHKLFSC